MPLGLQTYSTENSEEPKSKNSILEHQQLATGILGRSSDDRPILDVRKGGMNPNALQYTVEALKGPPGLPKLGAPGNTRASR